VPEIHPDHAPSPKAVLGTDLANYYVLRVDATGHLQVHVLTSGLPVGAATAAAQALALAQLQLIEDLRDALQSVASDRLIVRGEDQLFSYRESLLDRATGLVSGADGFFDSNGPAAGTIWKITNIRVVDVTSPTTQHNYLARGGGIDRQFGQEILAFGAGANSHYHGEIWLDPDDVVRVYFIGSLANDTCYIDLTGYQMTVEA